MDGNPVPSLNVVGNGITITDKILQLKLDGINYIINAKEN
jgi:hypothetical protein